MPAPDRTYRLADCGIYLRQVMRLPHTAQAVYFYLREGPRSQRSYVVEVNYPEIAGRLSTSVPAARRAVAQLVDAGLLELDEAAELGWLCADARRFPPANSSVTTSILRDLSAYTTSVLLTKVRDFLTATRDTVPDTVPDTVRHTQGVRDSGIQGSSKRTPRPTVSAPKGAKTARVVKPKAPSLADNPPTLADTIAVLTSEGCPSGDADRIARACLGYWESAGWKRKTGPILSWPGTVRTWLANQCEWDAMLALRVEKNRHPTTPSATADKGIPRLPPMTNWENEGYASEQEYNDAQPY